MNLKNNNYPRFKTFFMGGFECASPLTREGVRLDLLQDTRHDIYCREDYKILKDINIYTVREGFAWSRIDTGNGVYDFSRFEKMIAIAKEEGIEQIWDLSHFDYPSYLDAFSPAFVEAFAAYAGEAIKLLRRYHEGVIYIVPINEISFFSYMCEGGGWAPFATGRGLEFKIQLVKATMRAIDVIRSIDSNTRFITVEPIIYRKAKSPHTPRSRQVAGSFKAECYQAWDMLCGKVYPELGGNPGYLDIIGVNYYPNNQEWVIDEGADKNLIFEHMAFKSKHRRSFAHMLHEVRKRYKVPVLVSETGSWGTTREWWWKKMLKNVSQAAATGTRVTGICAYPIIDRRDWHQGHLTNSGLWDFAAGDLTCKRIPHEKVISLIKNYKLNVRKKPNVTVAFET